MRRRHLLHAAAWGLCVAAAGQSQAQLLPVPGPGRAATAPPAGPVAVSAAGGLFVTATASASLAHTITGSQRLLVVGMGWENQAVAASTCTYGGVPLTLRLRQASASGVVELWSLVAPALGTASVQVTLSATSAFLGLGAVSFTGVSQGTPHGTPVAATSFTPGTASVTAAAAAGDLVLDTCWTTCCAPMVPDAAQTVQVNVYDGATTGQSLGLSTKPGAASVLMAWTGIQAQWTLIALPIHP